MSADCLGTEYRAMPQPAPLPIGGTIPVGVAFVRPTGPGSHSPPPRRPVLASPGVNTACPPT
eukprot:14531257-Alexandrium_andersonii.AAC.1